MSIELAQAPSLCQVEAASKDEEKAVIDQTEHAADKLHEVVVDKDAAGYTDPTVEIDDADNKRLRRMINLRVLPCMCACYLAQALDKGAISTASIMGLQKDTGMVGQDYAWATTAFNIGVIVGQFPSNRAIQILPLGKLMSGALILWGIILLIMGLMDNYKPILALRLLLGLGESVVGPVLLATSVMWYRRTEQIFVVNTYISSYGFGSIISGLLGWGFYQVQPGQVRLKAWQMLFVIIAALSIVLGVVVGIFLPDSPPRAKCFSERDKVLMVERVRSNDQGIKNPKWNWAQFREGVTDIYVCTLVVGGLGTFQGLLINQAFGFSVSDAQLLQMPLGNFQVLLYMSSAWLAHRYMQSIYTLLAMCIPNIVGTIVLLTVTPSQSTRGGLLVAFYIMQSYQAQTPLYYQLCSRNVAGHTKRVFAYAAVFTANGVGNAISSQLFQAQWAPRYMPTLYIHLGLYAAMIVMLLSTRLLLVTRNRTRDARRDSGEVVETSHLHAFEDLTDKQNPDFRYML
ncbi:hypothetical protein EHS25_000834 [Saitozyma podzolica]|uniref:Major facilitator superfamily (MFS) profile domain-containing protein n=1 Tax=Saitozyma podzolica TaxID=1890683 RepID=A0A427YXD9_9TREE|nr:hypothetical protein EHS25_000834 [Saitozyma podzolica]